MDPYSRRLFVTIYESVEETPAQNESARGYGDVVRTLLFRTRREVGS